MRTALDIRKQLVEYCEKLEIPEVVGAGAEYERRAVRASWTM